MKRRRLLLALSILLPISLAINAFQARRILHLQDALDTMSVRGSLTKGTQIPKEFRALGQDGREATIRFASSQVPTVLYIFSPSCMWCKRNSESINTLAKETSGRYALIGLSLSEEGLAEFVKEHHCQFPAYSHIPAPFLEALRLGSTPQTIVVSPSATVLENWTGAYTGIRKSLAESFFSIRLPELPAAVEYH